MEQKTKSKTKLSTCDIEAAFDQVMPLDTNSDEALVVFGEDEHRHTVVKIQSGLYLAMDIGEDVIVSLVRSSDAGIARYMLENFRGYEVYRLGGFDLGSVHEGDVIP